MINKRLLAGLLMTSGLVLTGCASVQANKEERQQELTTKIQTAKINAQLGIAYLEQRMMERAKRKLLLALRQAPQIPEPWYSMGYFLESTGSKQEARQYYIKAIAIAPNRGDTHNNYGTYLCRQKQYQAAIKQFMVALTDHNYLTPAAAYENAGLCAMKIPNQKKALYYFQQALLHDPNLATSTVLAKQLLTKRVAIKTKVLQQPMIKHLSQQQPIIKHPYKLQPSIKHLSQQQAIIKHLSQVKARAKNIYHKKSYS
jgi:type IV pilus assembly protein PilF